MGRGGPWSLWAGEGRGRACGQGRQTPGKMEAGYVVGRPERGLGVEMQPMAEAAIVPSPLGCPRASGTFLKPSVHLLLSPAFPLGRLFPIVGAPELSQREGNRTFSDFYVIFVCPAGDMAHPDSVTQCGHLEICSLRILSSSSPPFLLTHSPEKILLLLLQGCAHSYFRLPIPSLKSRGLA